MALSQQLPMAANLLEHDSALAKSLAPEEVRVGDFVAVLHVTYELPSFYWCAESFRIPYDQPVRLQLLPSDTESPLKVRSICLPFVLVKSSDGSHRTLDMRRHRLARLSRRFAKMVWKVAKKTNSKVGCEL
jgi:hypothetical protein